MVIRILKCSLVVFGIVCITGCPPPDRMNFVFDIGETSDIRWKDSGYAMSVGDIRPWMMKRGKEITLDLGLRNTSTDSLQLICANSMIYSKNDTFTLQDVTRFYLGESLKDTITFAPGDSAMFSLIFLGNKKYSYWRFRKTNRRDTFYLRLNLFDIDTFTLPMRNHHSGFIWNTY